MILVYFKNERGEIINCYEVPKNMTPTTVPWFWSGLPEIKNATDCLAFSKEFEEGSLEEYLYRKSEKMRLSQEERIRRTLEALKIAEDEINAFGTDGSVS